MFDRKIEVPEPYRRMEVQESWDPRAKTIIGILDDCIEERKAARAAAAQLSTAAASPPPHLPFWRRQGLLRKNRDRWSCCANANRRQTRAAAGPRR